MRTLLFDIDGTLLLTNQGGSGALELALSQEFGLTNPNVDIAYGGRTDRSLLAQLLLINELPDHAENRERLRQRYVSVFPQVLQQRGGQVLPGIPELLQRLSAEPTVRVCVMTGNLTETGRQKLQHFDLLKYVDWISGGALDADRSDLARRTAELVSDRHGDDAADNIIVIGDTSADVVCGHAISAKVVAVCTGSHSRDRLESEKPFTVLDDLSQTDLVFDLLVS